MRNSLLASLCLLLVLADGAATQRKTRNTWTTPHVLTIADGGDTDTLNPHLTNFATAANLSELTMAWLVRWDEQNRPYPELALEIPDKNNGGVSRDGRTITYHLRKGVVWSDGAPFTADDVLFSVNVVNNPANHETTRFDQIVRVDEPDKYTAVFHLKRPYALATAAFFSSCCANPPLLPKHLLSRYANINDVAYNDLPVGIGPFTFLRWDRGRDVVLVANPRYWRGRPKLERIVYEIVPNRDALYALLKAHKLDMWYQFSGAYLPRIQAVSGLRVWRQPSYAYNHYDFNLSHAAVADVRVRQALRLAFDRRALVDTVLHGAGSVQDSATPRTAPYFVDLPSIQYDPEKAKALLDAAGWKTGPDGIRTKDGVRLSLRVAARSGAPDLDAELGLLAKDWRQVGVDLSVQHYPPAKLFGQAGIINGDSWDVTTFAWAADPSGDYSSMYGCRSFPPAGFNNLRWCNKTADAAMNDLLENYDQPARSADVRVAMNEFVKDVPSIVSYMRVDLFAYNNDLRGYHPNNLTPFDNMMDVDI